jgi:hypothetical protein
MRTLQRVATVVVWLAGASCVGDSPTSPVCFMDERVGLFVEVREAATGTPLAAGTSVTASAGEYQEQLQADLDGLTFYGLHERPGVYELRITHAGYRSVILPQVTLQQGPCHVETRTIAVALQAGR